MSPSQKDDEGQEWEKVRRVSDHYVRPWDLWFGNRLVAVRLSEADIDAILADHHDAQQLRERVRVLEEAAFLQRFQLRTAWFNLGCRCGFDDQHHKLFEDAHCPWHGTQVMKDSWEAVAGFSDDGTPLLPSSVLPGRTEGGEAQGQAPQ